MSERDGEAIAAGLEWLNTATTLTVSVTVLTGVVREYPESRLSQEAINFARRFAKRLHVADPREPDWAAATVRWLEQDEQRLLLVSSASVAFFLRGFGDSVHATALAREIVGVGGQHFKQGRGGA